MNLNNNFFESDEFSQSRRVTTGGDIEFYKDKKLSNKNPISYIFT